MLMVLLTFFDILQKVSLTTKRKYELVQISKEVNIGISITSDVGYLCILHVNETNDTLVMYIYAYCIHVTLYELRS